MGDCCDKVLAPNWDAFSVLRFGLQPSRSALTASIMGQNYDQIKCMAGNY